jgi:hypothetical protein
VPVGGSSEVGSEPELDSEREKTADLHSCSHFPSLRSPSPSHPFQIIPAACRVSGSFVLAPVDMNIQSPETPDPYEIGMQKTPSESSLAGSGLDEEGYNYLDHESDGEVSSKHGDSEGDTPVAELDASSDEDDGTEYATQPAARESFMACRLPPTQAGAEKALADIKLLLKPRRKTGGGYLWGSFPPLLRERLERVRMLLWTFIDRTKSPVAQGKPCSPQWMSASLATAHAHERGVYYARQLHSWAKAFILDRDDLPFDLFGTSKLSRIDNDELAAELHTHLQSIGKYVKAANLVQYLSDSLVQKRFGMKSTISLATAKRWMHTLGYRWLRDHRGQYVDGHEHADVIGYRQGVFIPAMSKNEQCLQTWEKDGITSKLTLSPGQCRVEEWFHDEVTFYANDRRHSGWIHIDAGSDPCPKGEGTSIMVSDFVSADQGWCCSPDGQESARVLFRAGKARDGWFTNEDILKQTS